MPSVLRPSRGRACGETIEDGGWPAHGVKVCTGVRIGRRSVVPVGTIVTADIPPDMLLVSNPARAHPLRLVKQ